jgi:hypothetical protein
MATDSNDRSPGGWADKPDNQKLIRRVLYGACALLVLADFIVHRHISTDVERVPAFYALYGFVALVGVVMAAKGLRRLVKRDEEYFNR